MGKPVKIAVIGAGSATFSLGLVKDVCLTPNLEGSLVSFMDIDQGRLDMIHRLAERYAAELGVRLMLQKTTDRRAALQDADFVINSALVGGHDHLEAVRQVAKKHGYAGMYHLAEDYHQFGLMLSVAR